MSIAGGMDLVRGFHVEAPIADGSSSVRTSMFMSVCKAFGVDYASVYKTCLLAEGDRSHRGVYRYGLLTRSTHSM